MCLLLGGAQPVITPNLYSAVYEHYSLGSSWKCFFNVVIVIVVVDYFTYIGTYILLNNFDVSVFESCQTIISFTELPKFLKLLHTQRE